MILIPIDYNFFQQRMGNGQSESTINSNHPKFRECLRDGKNLVLSPHPSPFLNDWVRRLKQFKSSLNPEHRLLLPNIEETVGGKFCGTEVSYKFIYPNFEFNLKKQIADRKPSSQKFTQPELWYLLYQLLFCSYEFQKHKMKSGDIRPANILLNEDGEMQLVNIYSFPDQSSNYFKSLKHHDQTFLSPEELWELEQKIEHPKSDQATAESFSIGMTLMDAALLTNSEDLYDCKKIRFANSIFNDNIVHLKTDKYSPFFVKTVLNLVEGKGVERITPGEAWAIIRPYKEQINNLQEFAPDREESKKSLQAFQAWL